MMWHGEAQRLTSTSLRTARTVPTPVMFGFVMVVLCGCVRRMAHKPDAGLDLPVVNFPHGSWRVTEWVPGSARILYRPRNLSDSFLEGRVIQKN